MKRFSTQYFIKLKNDKNESRKAVQDFAPQQETLDFISQFARVYHAESELDPLFCGLILN